MNLKMGQICVKCGEPATVNIQKLWVKWRYYNDRDEYSSNCECLDIPQLDNENFHFCNNCAKLWGERNI